MTLEELWQSADRALWSEALEGYWTTVAPSRLNVEEEMAAATAPGGQVILSGLLNDQADAVIAVYRAAGYDLRHRDAIVDWTTLVLVRQT